MSGPIPGGQQYSMSDGYNRDQTDAMLLSATRSGNYCTVTGTADAVVLTTQSQNNQVDAWQQGDSFWFIAESTNTGDATVQRDGQIAKQLVTVTGSELPAGYLRTDAPNHCWYDAVNDWVVVDRGIERGSNVNGEYVKHTNGVQFCRRFISRPNQNFSAFNGDTYDHPSPFSSLDLSMSLMVEKDSQAVNNHSLYCSHTATQFTLRTNDGAAVDAGMYMKAEGNWYEYVDPTA